MLLLVVAVTLALAQAENMRCPYPDTWKAQTKLHLRIDNYHQKYNYSTQLVDPDLLSSHSITLYPGQVTKYRKLFYLDEGWYENQTKGISLDTYFFYDGNQVCASYTFLENIMRYNYHDIGVYWWKCQDQCFPVKELPAKGVYDPEHPTFKYSQLITRYQFFEIYDDYAVQLYAQV